MKWVTCITSLVVNLTFLFSSISPLIIILGNGIPHISIKYPTKYSYFSESDSVTLSTYFKATLKRDTNYWNIYGSGSIQTRFSSIIV